jgi:amidophosphoribosyltransferase
VDFYKKDKMEEECGVIGIFDESGYIAQELYYGLFALQHRGQESAGIAVSDGKKIRLHKDMGLVTEAFSQEDINKLKGHCGIGHVRYLTEGSDSDEDAQGAQPILATYLAGEIALANNGSITNSKQLRENLANSGSVFQSSVDTELIINLIARYGQTDIVDSLMKVMIDLKGSYAMVIMNKDKLIGIRDPYGNRPLCIGKLGKKGYVLASESCALDTVGASFYRDVEPGEIIIIDKSGLKSKRIFPANKKALCIFEYIYFARPDSTIDGINVNVARKKMGEALADEYKIDVDVIIPVPDSGTVAGIGYAERTGLPFAFGLLKNRYAGRTFINPTQQLREIGVKLKLNPIREIINGKRVALVDDSIVRGTTSKKIIEMVRQAGAKEVHMLVTSPPVTKPCFYGIDTADEDQLVATGRTIKEIEEYIKADSLHYLSVEGLCKALNSEEGFCDACFTGNYPIEINDYKI